MATKTEGFGFCPEESTHHFVVFIPPSNRAEVLISEHYGYDAEARGAAASLGLGADDGKARVLLARPKWNAIADDLRVELNRRLKKQGLKTGTWKTGKITPSPGSWAKSWCCSPGPSRTRIRRSSPTPSRTGSGFSRRSAGGSTP